MITFCPRFAARGFPVAAMFFAAMLLPVSATRAQNPPPGSIFDLSTVHSGVLNTQTTFNTSFVGDGNTEFVSFAFREQPAFFLFDNASVTTGGGPNLLTNSDFATAMVGQNCNHGNSLGCPPGWGAWIQPVDISFIGQVVSSSISNDCSNEGGTGNFWCDGSVQGYDGIYQTIATTNGATYHVGWLLDDNSGQAINNPAIDMLVYAGDSIPVGTIAIGTPEPSSLLLLGAGLLALVLVASKKRQQILA